MAKVLIVDDEVGIRSLLSETLADEGYAIFSAANAQEARDIVAKTPMDVILLDIWMPDTDGVTLLKEWKTNRAFKSQVVMMSGHATIETAIEATKFGSLSFLEKPFSTQKLLDTVKHAVEVGARILRFAGCKPEEKKEELSPPELPAQPVVLPKLAIPGTTNVIDFTQSLREVRETLEKAYFSTLIRYHKNQVSAVANHAGLERTHLYRKLKNLDIAIPKGKFVVAESPKD